MIKLRSQMTFALGASVIIMGIGFATSVLLTRALLPEGRGIIAAAMLWPAILQAFGSLGLIDSIVYFVAKNEYHTGTIFYNGIVIGLIQAALLIPTAYFILPMVLSSQNPHTIELSRAYLLLIPIGMLTQYGIGIFQGLMHSTKFNLMRMIVPTGYFFTVVGTTLLGICTPDIVILALLILNFGTLIVVLLLLRGTTAYTQWSLNIPLIVDLFKYGTRSIVGSMFSTVNLRLDQVLLAAWTSPTMLGLYVVAVSAANLILLLPTALHLVLPAAIAREADEAKRMRLIELILPMFWSATLLIIIVLSIVFPVLIPLLYGPETAGSVTSAEILLIGTLMMCGRMVLTSVAFGLGAPLLSSRAEAVSAIITIVLLLIFIRPFGIIGASVTSVIAYGTSMIVLGQALHHRFGLHLWHLLNPSVGISVLLAEAKRFVHAMQTRIEQRRVV